MFFFFFFFNDTATTEIYTLSLHDALPICPFSDQSLAPGADALETLALARGTFAVGGERDRKSTRLNSSHSQISYAVFCLKKKKISRDAYVKLHRTEQYQHYGESCDLKSLI